MIRLLAANATILEPAPLAALDGVPERAEVRCAPAPAGNLSL